MSPTPERSPSRTRPVRGRRIRSRLHQRGPGHAHTRVTVPLPCSCSCSLPHANTCTLGYVCRHTRHTPQICTHAGAYTTHITTRVHAHPTQHRHACTHVHTQHTHTHVYAQHHTHGQHIYIHTTHHKRAPTITHTSQYTHTTNVYTHRFVHTHHKHAYASTCATTHINMHHNTCTHQITHNTSHTCLHTCAHATTCIHTSQYMHITLHTKNMIQTCTYTWQTQYHIYTQCTDTPPNTCTHAHTHQDAHTIHHNTPYNTNMLTRMYVPQHTLQHMYTFAIHTPSCVHTGTHTMTYTHNTMCSHKYTHHRQIYMFTYAMTHIHDNTPTPQVHNPQAQAHTHTPGHPQRVFPSQKGAWGASFWAKWVPCWPAPCASTCVPWDCGCLGGCELGQQPHECVYLCDIVCLCEKCVYRAVSAITFVYLRLQGCWLTVFRTGHVLKTVCTSSCKRLAHPSSGLMRGTEFLKLGAIVMLD